MKCRLNRIRLWFRPIFIFLPRNYANFSQRQNFTKEKTFWACKWKLIYLRRVQVLSRDIKTHCRKTVIRATANFFHSRSIEIGRGNILFFTFWIFLNQLIILENSDFDLWSYRRAFSNETIKIFQKKIEHLLCRIKHITFVIIFYYLKINDKLT